MAAKREEIWDFIKGIGICFVLYWHSFGGWDYLGNTYFEKPESFTFNSWFIPFTLFVTAVPVFFFISGYMTPSTIPSIKTYYGKRLKRILLPFLVWSGIYTLANVFLYHQSVTVVSFLLGTNAIQLYYLVVMLQLVLITPVLVAVRQRKGLLILCIFITLVNNLMHMNYWLKFHDVPANEFILFTGFLAYYYLGIFFKTTGVAEKLNCRRGRLVCGTLLVGGAAVMLLAAYHFLDLMDSVPVATSYNSPFVLLYAATVILFIMAFKDCFRSNALTKKIAWVGVHSMDFFLAHWLVMMPMKTWIYTDYRQVNFWLRHLVLSALTFILCFLYIQLKNGVVRIYGKQSR